MGVFDWLGPLNVGTKARGWGALPAPIETRAVEPIDLPRPMPLDGSMSYWTPLTTTLTASDAAGSSAVAACLGVLATAVTEPPLVAYRPGAAGSAERTPVDLPALDALLSRPNGAFPLAAMLAFATISTRTHGNGYWRKVRSGDPVRGNVVQLWPLAADRVSVYTRAGSSDFITSYGYTDDNGRALTLDPANVVHFRHGLDPDDFRLGYAPLRRLVDEVAADQQATRYASRLLANLAINGLTLSFDKDSPPIDQATADALKARIAAAFGGNNVGATAVLSPGGTLTALGFSPEQMDLSTLHRVPEERICAVLGVPAAMVGLGVGLEHSIYNNVRQAEEHFTERTLIPTWGALAATLTMSLLPDFTSDKNVFLAFDTSNVRALAEDQDALAARLVALTAAGILTEDEARAVLGREPKPPGASPAPSPAATRARPRLVRLPAETKAAEDLLRDFDRLRHGALPDWEREVLGFLQGQLGRVTSRLRDGVSTAHGLVPQGEAVLLGRTLAPLQLALLDDTLPLVIAELGVAFGLDDAQTRLYLQQSGANIAGITDTTREAVRAALIEGQRNGEGIPELARRLRALPAFSQARANVVARTELATAQNLSALASYKASGVVVGVRVHDSDADPTCAQMDGRTFALGDEPPMLEHPNCVRAFSPVLDASELTGAA